MIKNPNAMSIVKLRDVTILCFLISFGGEFLKNHHKTPDSKPIYIKSYTVVGVKPHVTLGRSYKINGKRYHPKYQPNYVAKGIASWYGPGFHGKETANGDTFNTYEMVAAHATLPLPCKIEVTNLENGKTIKVTVKDRGPYRKNRILDLSYAAAKELDIIHHGFAKVRVKYLDNETKAMLKRQGLFEQFCDKVLSH